MTYSDFKFYEREIVDIINEVLDVIREKSFSDYVLLLARAGYQVEVEGTFLSPYVLSSPLEAFQDRTRERFLVNYLNSYTSLLRDGTCIPNDLKEYNLNIQMMIYSQIWESHQFLKTLKRIGDLLTGKSYEWKISFEYVNEKDKVKPILKSRMILNQIIEPLKNEHPKLGKILDTLYDARLRNDFSHASYYIDIERNVVVSLDSEKYAVKQETNLLDWEQKFIYSVLLSYYLPQIIRERCNCFTTNYPEIRYVDIDWPSYKKPGKMLPAKICPIETEWGVEFDFIRYPRSPRMLY